MSLFSAAGLKAAYESIGGELTRTFDSSGAGREAHPGSHDEEEETDGTVSERARCVARVSRDQDAAFTSVGEGAFVPSLKVCPTPSSAGRGGGRVGGVGRAEGGNSCRRLKEPTFQWQVTSALWTSLQRERELAVYVSFTCTCAWRAHHTHTHTHTHTVKP